MPPEMGSPDIAVSSALLTVGPSFEVRNAGLLAQFIQGRFAVENRGSLTLEGNQGHEQYGEENNGGPYNDTPSTVK